MRQRSSPAGPAPTQRAWRVTTAVRAFVLAVAIGQVLGSGAMASVSLVLITLLLIAAACSTVELRASGGAAPWVSVLEGVTVAALLGPADVQAEPLLIYLAVPPIVAGIRHGLVTTTNTSLATSLAVAGAWTTEQAVGHTAEQVPAAIPWLVIGLGVGLLAAWQTRAVRSLEANQAPYAAAHRLVSQLHTLTRKVSMGLDSSSTAEQLAASFRTLGNASRSVVLLRTATGALESLTTSCGDQVGFEEATRLCLTHGKPVQRQGLAAFPLRVGDHVFGVMVLGRDGSWPKGLLEALQPQLDAQALRLETALLFDEVRSMATSEERNRLAREMHDGMAQEIVSLGYLVDEIEDVSKEPATVEAAARLRKEITRVVGELRFSIFDLRHQVEGQRLSGALAEYVREMSAGAGLDLRVHLMLDEQGAALPPRTEAELLRIAQEAIGNVRRHAKAINLWVTFVTDGEALRLVIEDDGVGSAAPRPGHYGLHTMRERAERIDAELTVAPRPDGGTVITLQTVTTPLSREGSPHAHQRPARR